MNKKILVIDDDRSLCQMIKYSFEDQGATVNIENDGQEGLNAFYDFQPDLVILDIRMPAMSGWEVCKNIRLMSNVPVIMLTTLHRDEDQVRAYNNGADDYVTKPFSNDVLLAKVQAIFRRTEAVQKSDSKPEINLLSVYDDGYLTINLENRSVLVKGEPVKLTSTEYRLFSHLFTNQGQLLSYESILNHIWGWEYQDSVSYVHVYMSYLRKKIEKDPRNPVYFVTEFGRGCAFYPM